MARLTIFCLLRIKQLHGRPGSTPTRYGLGAPSENSPLPLTRDISSTSFDRCRTSSASCSRRARSAPTVCRCSPKARFSAARSAFCSSSARPAALSRPRSSLITFAVLLRSTSSWRAHSEFYTTRFARYVCVILLVICRGDAKQISNVEGVDSGELKRFEGPTKVVCTEERRRVCWEKDADDGAARKEETGKD